MLGDAVGMPPLTGPYLFTIVGQSLGILLYLLALRPDPLLTAQRVVAAGQGTQAAAEIVKPDRPRIARYAIFAVAAAHGVMVSVMAMTPVHLLHHGADLTIIGAHMGHPYESLFINLMRKWENHYLSCSAYAPRYLDPELLRYMGSSVGRGRVLWASDDPWFPMQRSIDAARGLDLDAEAMDLFLGGTARRLLDRAARA